MLNQAVLVGRLVKNPEVKELEDGKKVSNITLAVQRSYKNAEGKYDVDFVDCVLWDSAANNASEYCHQGDLVGVKGRVQTNNYETEEGEKKKVTNIVAERVTFLSSKHPDKSDDISDDEDLDM